MKKNYDEKRERRDYREIDVLKCYQRHVIYYRSGYRKSWPVYEIITYHPVSWETLVGLCRGVLMDAAKNGYVPEEKLYERESFVVGNIGWESLFINNRELLEKEVLSVTPLVRIPFPSKDTAVHEVLEWDVLVPFQYPESDEN